MFVMYFECYFSAFSMVLFFSEVHRKPGGVKSLPSMPFSHL